MTYRSRSTLFLIEQLIVIAVFAICAAACIRILTAAYFNAVDSRDVSNAMIVAENGAEVFKATGGDTAAVVKALGGVYDNTSGLQQVYYDKSWQVCGETDAYYTLSVYSAVTRAYHAPLQLYIGELNVDKISGENLVKLPMAARSQ